MKPLPIQALGDRLTLHLLDERDTPWITALIDEVEAAVGQPWRELLERVDRLPARAASARRAAALDALRGTLGGRPRGALSAARVRRELFGRAALDPVARAARLTAVATELGAAPAAIEEALWADLPGERAVTLPDGRPSPLAVAAAANLTLIQRTLLRCHELRLQLRGNARGVVRTAAVRGLLTTARRTGDAIELEISGPLALFHRTTVYGRALGSIIPQLAWCEQFVLDARCDFGQGRVGLRLQPPLLLPASPPPARYDSALEARFARDMATHAPGWRVLREPAAIDAGARLAFPDFLLEHREAVDRRWWVEIVGFWTADYLVHKLATYRAANLARVILCIDAERAIDDRDLPPGARIVRFHNRVPVDDVLAIISAEPP